MVRKSQKCLNLSNPVLDRLEEEDNQSEKVEELLRDDYEMGEL